MLAGELEMTSAFSPCEGRAVGSLAEYLEGGLVPDPGAAKPHRHRYLPLLSGYEGGFVYPSADALADFVDIFHCCVWRRWRLGEIEIAGSSVKRSYCSGRYI